MRSLEAIQQSIQDRTHALKYRVTPEEQQLLGITSEDIASFSDESLMHSPAEIMAAVEEIIMEAYRTSPGFRKIFEEDIADDPSMMAETSQVVAGLLDHLGSILPPERRTAIKTDTYSQAQDIIRDVLHKQRTPQAPAQVQEEQIAPISPEELSFFNLKPEQLTAKTRWDAIKDHVLYFLGKLKNEAGKTIKNEATSKMPDEMKITILSKLLNDIRTKKLQTGEKLLPKDEQLFGKNLAQLKQIARSMVVRALGKEEPVYVNDLMEVNSKSGEVLDLIERITDVFSDHKLGQIISKMTDIIDQALPPVNYFQNKLEYIKDELSALELKKSQASALMDVNTEALTYSEPLKKALEDQQIALSDVTKQLKDKPDDEGLLLKKKNIEGQIGQLQDIQGKDTTALKKAIEGYLDMLRESKEKIKTSLTTKNLGDMSILEEFIGLVNDLALKFGSLSKENMFKARWAGRSGYMVKNLSPESTAPTMSKEAADTVSGYTRRLNEFRGKGLVNSYQQIDDIITEDGGLPAVRGKLVRILSFADRKPEVDTLLTSGKDVEEIKSGIISLLGGRQYGKQLAEILSKHTDLGKIRQIVYNIMEKDPRQYSDVSTEDIDLDVAIKMINKLRTLTKQLNFEDKGSEALEVLSWMADLGHHFKAPKKKPTSEKIKKLAMMMFAADGETPKGIGVQGPEGPRTYGPKGWGDRADKYQNPAGVGSDTPMPSTGKAQPILYRSRQTKMGKKALQSVFAEPTFVPVLVEEMEKAGLSKGLLEGGKMPPVDIDKILETVLQKITGKEGTLENILDSKVLQAYKAEEYDLPRVQKDLDEAISRRKELNDKIDQVEKQYIPRLTSFALFIQNPIAAVQEKMKKGLTGEPEEKKKEDDVLWMKEEVKPHTITPENFQKVLSDLSFRYAVRMPESPKKAKQAATDTEERPTRTVKKFLHSDLSKKLPTDFFKQYQIWKKILKDLKRGVDSKKDAYQRSVALEKYYSYMMMVIRNLKGFFGYQDDMMAADKQTIENLESFLRSGESRTVVNKERAAARIKELKKAYTAQEQMYNTIKKEHPKLDSVERITNESLTEVRGDIKKKDIETLRGIAVSPELHPSKEKAREIKERAREHEKGLSFIIDRSTYKNNMNKIMTYKPPREKIEWPDNPENPTFLPEERKKELEKAVEEAEKLKDQMKARLDYEHKVIALRDMEQKLKTITAIKNETERKVLTFEEALRQIPWSEMLANQSKISEENKGQLTRGQIDQFNKDMEIINGKVPSIFNDVKDMKKKLEAAQNAKERDTKVIDEYEKKFQDLLKTYNQQAEELKKEKGKAPVVDVKDQQQIEILEKEIPRLRAELEKTQPPELLKIKLTNLMQVLYRLRGMEQDTALRPKTPEQRLALLQEKLKSLEELKAMKIQVQPGTEEGQMYRKFLAELEQMLRTTQEALRQAQTAAPMAKKAAIEDRGPDLSPYERALEERGKEPPPFIKEIKKPKGWEIVEDFFHNVKREHKFLSSESRKKGTPIRTDFLERRLSQLQQMAKAIDSYKKQLIHIDWKAPDPKNPDKMIDYKQLVPFEETMNKFEELLFEYQDLVRKFTNQRNDTEKRIADLQQHVHDLKGLFDDEGKFKGMSPEKLKSLKNIFLRLLYRDLESYWASNVGQQLSVFGERATDWYNNVYHTFKEVAKSRSNKKMLGMINKFKKETRSEMDDIIHRTKAQELEDERDELMKTLTEMGIDPETSPRLGERIKTLNTRIETIRKQEKQIDQVFNFMGAASIVSMQADFEEMLRKKIKKLDNEVKQETVSRGKEHEDLQKDEELAVQDVDLNDEAQQEVDKAIDQVEKALPVIAENKKDVDEAEQIISAMKEERGEPVVTKKPEGPMKMSYDKNHRDFNLNILYGSFMQNVIASMIAEEIK